MKFLSERWSFCGSPLRGFGEEILEEALRVSGAAPSEAVLIGDSEETDVKCALENGIVPILLDRKGTADRKDIQVIHSLEELF